MSPIEGIAYINNGEGSRARLSIEQEMQVHWSRGPRLDPAWEFVDAAGHFHAVAFDKHDRLPTLVDKSIPMPCDGSCGGACEGDGYSRTSCRICREVVEPGLVEGPYSFTVPGLVDWWVEVEAYVPVHYGDLVSVRFLALTSEYFGTGQIGASSAARSSSGITEALTHIHGGGPLGERARRPAESSHG